MPQRGVMMEGPRWDNIFQRVLRDVLSQNEKVTSSKSLSVGSERTTLEALNYSFTLLDPRDRILWNPVREFNLYGAIARFFWMIAGNDRVKDIAFYEPKALGFSDDAMTVPGSNYGTRLFMPEPGLDQIKAIIDRIRDDHGTRRALAVIYQPEDAVRVSKDIPCALGLAFHVRAEKLQMTMLMRSNAAWTLLPYNLFEFTLLGELVSVITGISLGTYNHIALSMHIYAEEFEASERATNIAITELPSPMGVMPSTNFDDLRRMNDWEGEIRYDAKGINVTNYRDYIKKCQGTFDPYWVQLCLPLLAYVLFIQKKISAGLSVLDEIKDPLHTVLSQHKIVKGLNLPGLEEDPILLESRLNLLKYAETDRVPEPRREILWRDYQEKYSSTTLTAAPGERHRESPVTVERWRRLDREGEQQELV